MNRTIRRIMLLVAGLAVIASVASAQDGVPDAERSIYDPIAVGSSSGASFLPGWNITVNDWNGLPVAGTSVALWFVDSGVKAYAAQNPGTTVDAVHHVLIRTATTGSTTFIARTGGFDNVGVVTVVASKTVEGLPNAVTLTRNLKWRSTDIDGLGASTGLGDVSYFATRYLQVMPSPECNLDLKPGLSGDPDVPGLGDLALIASEYLMGIRGSYAW